VAVALSVLLWAAAPSGAQTEVAIVGVGPVPGGPGPNLSIYIDCDGVEHLLPEVAGFIVGRSGGDVDSPLTVGLSYSGTMVPHLVEAPATVTIPAGSDLTFVDLETTEPGPATLRVTVEDGDDYDPGSPNEVAAPAMDLDSGPPELRADCRAPLDTGEEFPLLTDQTIGVGEVPEPLGIPYVNPDSPPFGPRDVAPPDSLYTEVRGTLPPGLTYEDDIWGGAATTPGDYRFGVSSCSVVEDIDPLAGICSGTVQVRIRVVTASTDPPAGAAPAATPVSGAARFTG
jgi:hypothetical protein